MSAILTKVNGSFKRLTRGAAGGVLFFLPITLFYSVKRSFAGSLNKIKHGVQVLLGRVIDAQLLEKEKKYGIHTRNIKKARETGVGPCVEASRNNIIDNKIRFFAPNIVTGIVSHLTQEQLVKIKTLNLKSKNQYLNIDIVKENNKIIVEIDVERITKAIRSDSKYKGKSLENINIKGIIIEQIKQIVDLSFMELAQVTKRKFKFHSDQKLLYNIARKLYKEYDDKQIKYTRYTEDFNMTNPGKFPFHSISEAKNVSTKEMLLSQNIKRGFECASNFGLISHSNKEVLVISSSMVNNAKRK